MRRHIIPAVAIALMGLVAASASASVTGALRSQAALSWRPPVLGKPIKPDPLPPGTPTGPVVGGDGANTPGWPDLIAGTPDDRVKPNPCGRMHMCEGDEGATGVGQWPDDGATGVCAKWCVVTFAPNRPDVPDWEANDPPPDALPNNDVAPPGTSGSCQEYSPTADPTDDPAATECSYWQRDS